MRIANLDTVNRMIDTVQYNSRNEAAAQKEMSTGKRVDRPSDDPGAAINSVYQRTQLARTEQYRKNVGEARDTVNIGHDALGDVTQVLQRVRELAVQGANGTYTQEDRQAMAFEVEELLKHTLQVANTKQEDRYFFAGETWKNQPFDAKTADTRGLGRPLIEKVRYTGSGGEQKMEIGEGDTVSVALAGNRAFQAGKHTVVSLTDAGSFALAKDSKISVDGVAVALKAGDTLDSVIDRINRAVPSARAFRRELPGGESVLELESSDAHRLMLEDLEGGSTLADLGVLRSGKEGHVLGDNIHPNTLESGGSVFDVMIRFRNALLDNDVEGIGSRDLAGLGEALGAATSSQARLSAVATRLGEADRSLARSSELATERLSKNEDVDMAEAAIRYNQLEMVHRISLQTAAKLVQPTLMDHLR